MASVMHHIAIGQLYYEKYLSDYSKKDKNRFLLGTIAADCGKNKELEQKRMKTHFIDNKLIDEKIDLSVFTPNIDFFIEKYNKELRDPFVLGYLVHLITDKFWFEVVIPIFIRKNLDLIDSSVKVMDDLSHQIFLNWYHDTVYADFDVHDIIIGAMVFGEKVEFPNFLEFDLSNLLVDIIDEDELKKFLEDNYERLKFVRDISDEEAMEKFLAHKMNIKVADLSTTSEFINKCVDYCFEIINDN